MEYKSKKILSIVLGTIGGAGLVTGTGLIIAALLRKAPEIDNRITVTFELDDETIIEEGSNVVKLESASKFGLINKPSISKNGYIFAGWYTDPTFKEESKINDEATIDKNINAYAKFNPGTSVYIEFDEGTSGATIYGTKKVSIDKNTEFKDINKPTAVLKDWVFECWMSGSDVVTDTTKFTAGARLTPRFTNPYAEKAHVVFKAKQEDEKLVTLTGLTDFEVAKDTYFQDCIKPTATKPGKIFNKWVRKDSSGQYIDFDNYKLPAGLTEAYADFSEVDMEDKIYCIINDKSQWLTNPSDVSGDLVFRDANGNDTSFKRDEFNEEVHIGNKMPTIDINFLYGCSAFNNANKPLALPASLTSIGDSFLHNCSSFNQTIDFTKCTSLTKIGSSFLHKCSSYQQSLTIPDSVTSIGSFFLYECGSFNGKLTLSNSLTKIDGSFLEGCYIFNQKLTIPESVTSIESYFLGKCVVFNNGSTTETSNTLTIPNNVKDIGVGFLYGCNSFNSPITLPTNDNFTSITNSFMENCSYFNQTLTIPNSVTKIGNYFLGSCVKFNTTLTIPSSVTSLGSYFLNYCSSFNQNITIPSTITSIGINFMSNLCNMTATITFNADGNCITKVSGTYSKEYTLGTGNSTYVCYTKGITVTGTGASDLKTNFPNTTSAVTPPYRYLK